jgi:hypothetical protein
MEAQVQQAREMGEITSAIKSTNSILGRMEDKLDNAIAIVSNHSETIALLSRVSSENSGAIAQIQETVFGKDRQSGMARNVAELMTFKDNQCKLQEENRVATKRLFFSVTEKIVIWIGAIIVVGLVAFKELFK